MADNIEKNSSVKAISYVMIITLVGKFLGLIRDRLLAVNYGTGMEASAFLTASRIPRVFFDVLFATAISVSFIPVYSLVNSREGADKGERFAGNFITVVGMLTLVMSAVGILLAEPLVSLFADGYDADTANLCAQLARIMFPTVFFTGVAFSFVGILQSHNEFNIPAFISVLSNLVIIAYYIFFNDTFGIYGLAAAFLAGWLCQALVQLPSLKKIGFRYRPSLSLRNSNMKRVLLLMLPVLVSTWVQPLMLTVNTRFASHIYTGGGVPAVEYSTNLYLMIIGIFVLSVTNVIYPKLTRLKAEKKKDEFGDTVKATMHASMFFVIPMTIGVMALSYRLIDLIYGGGSFGAEDTEITSAAMFFITLGMPGYAVQNILSRVYFAEFNGRVPMLAGAAAIAADVILCVLLTDTMGVQGLSIAAAAAGTVNAAVLVLPLEIKGRGFIDGQFLIDCLKTLISGLVMAAVVYFTSDALSWMSEGTAGKLAVLAVSTAAGAVVFFAAAYAFRLREAVMVFDTVSGIPARFFGRKDG